MYSSSFQCPDSVDYEGQAPNSGRLSVHAKRSIVTLLHSPRFVNFGCSFVVQDCILLLLLLLLRVLFVIAKSAHPTRVDACCCRSFCSFVHCRLPYYVGNLYIDR